MKFEHVLHVYWANHILFNGRITKFNVSFQSLFLNTGGLKKTFKELLLKRFELNLFKLNPHLEIIKTPNTTLRSLNILLSQTSTVNNQVREVVRASLIRLYLIKSFRGRFQALGKPSRGQRTWSNAWSAHYSNRVIKNYITNMQNLLKDGETSEKTDYRRIKRKFKKPTKKKNVTSLKTLTAFWF